MRTLRFAAMATAFAAAGASVASETAEVVPAWMGEIHAAAARKSPLALPDAMRAASFSAPAEAPYIFVAGLAESKAAGEQAVGLVAAVISGITAARENEARTAAFHAAVFAEAGEWLPDEEPALAAMARSATAALEARSAAARLLDGNNANRFGGGQPNPANATTRGDNQITGTITTRRLSSTGPKDPREGSLSVR